MTRRRRVARLLERFGLWVFGPYVEAWSCVPQAEIDALIERVDGGDHTATSP